MEVKITSGLIWVLIALILVFLYVVYDNSKKLDKAAWQINSMSMQVNEIDKLLNDPTITTIK